MGRVLERGDLFFFYRPRVGIEKVDELEEVQRFFLVLKPDGVTRLRRLVVGRKRLPDPERDERAWAFVAQVTDDPAAIREEIVRRTYETKTRGIRGQPEARPAGEARYVVAEHEGHTHLAYALELPREPGEVQRELGIEREASYVVAVRNPEAPAPAGTGLPARERARYPDELRERFGDRMFIPLDPPSLLDSEGAELVLIGAAENASAELGIDLDAENERLQSADLVRDLRLRIDELATEPLEQGKWR